MLPTGMYLDKGLSIDECVRRAHAILKEQPAYLLLYDVDGSRHYKEGINGHLHALNEDLNKAFAAYLPSSDLRVHGEFDQGFRIIRGDSGVGALDEASIIPSIAEYQRREHPHLTLHWSVARDGYDDEGFSHIGL